MADDAQTSQTSPTSTRDRRRDGFGPVKRKKFLEAYAQSGNIRASCKHVGIDRKTFYNALAEVPGFAEAVKEADEEATELLEGVAWSKATTERDNTSLWNLLKARRASKYRETTNQNMNTEGTLTIKVVYADRGPNENTL